MTTQLTGRIRDNRTTSRTALVGGILAAVGGTFHLTVAAAMRRDVWSQIADDGLFDAISLNPTPDQLPTAEAFWFSPGSFGLPLALIGAMVIRSNRRGEPLPVWVGGGLTGWAAVIGYIGGPDAGATALLTIGSVLTAGSLADRRLARSTV